MLYTIEDIKWPDKISKPDLCQHTQKLQVSALIERSKLHWFGHLLWCAPSHPTLECYHFELRKSGWKRLRGNPQTQWTDNNEEDIQKMGKDIMALQEATSDCRLWQSIIPVVSSMPVVGDWWWLCIWLPYLFFLIYDYPCICCFQDIFLFPHLCQWLSKLYTHVYFY